MKEMQKTLYEQILVEVDQRKGVDQKIDRLEGYVKRLIQTLSEEQADALIEHNSKYPSRWFVPSALRAIHGIESDPTTEDGYAEISAIAALEVDEVREDSVAVMGNVPRNVAERIWPEVSSDKTGS